MPGIKELVSFGPEGVLYLAGFFLFMWGLFNYWPPTASNGRVMLGVAFLSWARGAHYWRWITYSEPGPPYTRRLSVHALLGFVAWFTSGCGFFWAFYTGANPLSQFIALP
ncbi:MAG: hypothetical protein L0312_29470 [Acidobacteria bacterium]|nr:hypothetical protein [Acidobacteriota bacterium]